LAKSTHTTIRNEAVSAQKLDGIGSCKKGQKMIQTFEGIFRNGKVELLESPPNIHEARVIVTFLSGDLAPSGEVALTPEEFAELDAKLEAWHEDWNAPGMEAYDDYEARRRGAGPIPPQ
jgi:hypothetical protein